MNIVFRVLFTVWVDVCILASFVVAFLAQLVTLVFAGPLQEYYRRLDTLGSVFRGITSIFVVTLNPLWSLRVVRRPQIDKPRGVIVMCNHLSNADPFLLCSALLPWETKYIAKGSLFNIPFGGWAMRLAGDLPVHFTAEKNGWGTKKGSVSQMMERAKELLQHGCNIAVFPEGVRSFDGELLPFKDGFFNLAAELGVPIIPTAISGPQKGWARGTILLDSADCQVAIGDPINPKGLSSEALKESVRAAITALQTTLPSTKVLRPLRPREKKDQTPIAPSTTPATATATATTHIHDHSE